MRQAFTILQLLVDMVKVYSLLIFLEQLSKKVKCGLRQKSENGGILLEFISTPSWIRERASATVLVLPGL